MAAGWWRGRLHAAGIVPHDIHASHVPVRPEAEAWRGWRFYLCNLDNCRIRGPVTARAAVRNFGQFHRSFEKAITRAEQLCFYRRLIGGAADWTAIGCATY